MAAYIDSPKSTHHVLVPMVDESLAALNSPLLVFLPAQLGFTSLSQGADIHAPSPIVETRLPLADGYLGTMQSLQAMADCVVIGLPPEYSGYSDPRVRSIAEEITEGAKSEREAIEKIHSFVCGNIKYLIHAPNEQRVQDAIRSMQLREADCVSMTVLVCSLAKSLGFDCRFCVQYYGDDQGFAHVIPEVYADGEWIAVDCVAKDKPLDYLQPLPDGGFNMTWEVN